MTFVKKNSSTNVFEAKKSRQKRVIIQSSTLLGFVWSVWFGWSRLVGFVLRMKKSSIYSDISWNVCVSGSNLLTLRVNQGLTKIGRECDADIYFLHENLASKQSKRDFSCTMNKWKVTASTSRLQFCKSWRFIKNAHQKLSQLIFATQSDKTAFYNINTRIYLSWSIN